MADASAATGIPPELPIRFWMSGCIVVSMNVSAMSLFLDFDGITHRLPLEPGSSLLPGKRNVPHWKFLISVEKVPYHQLPEIRIGDLPCSNALPMSVALRPAELFEM